LGDDLGDKPTMTVTADSKKRVVLPMARPGETFEVRNGGPGSITLTKLEPVRQRPAKVRIEKEGKYSVGVTDVPISEAAIREALAEFP
jgi:hypothetical protein